MDTLKYKRLNKGKQMEFTLTKLMIIRDSLEYAEENDNQVDTIRTDILDSIKEEIRERMEGK